MIGNPPPTTVRTRDLNVVIATPCYGGVSHCTYNRSVLSLHDAFNQHGIRHQILDIPTESLIPRARNTFANIVLYEKDPVGNPYSHLLFLDADIGFNPANIIEMLAWNKDIVALPYACKDIQWNKLIRAVHDKGITDPKIVSRLCTRPIINTNDAAVTFNTAYPVQFPQLGTGCLLIARHVLQRFSEDPARKYKLMEGERNGLDRDFGIDFFQIGINRKTGYYDSEDYRFCLDARDYGFETWLLPWAVTSHTGNMTFWMDIPGQAAYGVCEDDNKAVTAKPDTKPIVVSSFSPVGYSQTSDVQALPILVAPPGPS